MLVYMVAPGKKLELETRDGKIVIRTKIKAQIALEIEKSVKAKLVKDVKDSQKNHS